MELKIRECEMLLWLLKGYSSQRQQVKDCGWV